MKRPVIPYGIRTQRCIGTCYTLTHTSVFRLVQPIGHRFYLMREVAP